MKVKLLENWSYYNKGQVLYQDKALANELIKKKIAKAFEGITEDEKDFRRQALNIQEEE